MTHEPTYLLAKICARSSKRTLLVNGSRLVLLLTILVLGISCATTDVKRSPSPPAKPSNEVATPKRLKRDLYQIPSQKSEPGVVILKLDDLRYNPSHLKGVPSGWINVYNYLNEQDIHAGFGIIASASVEPSEAHIEFIQELVSNGHELWHHGWDHRRAGEWGEFCGHSYQRQKSHFERALTHVKATYGVTMQSFGTPYNCSDESLTRVFEEQSQVKVLMFADDPKPANALSLDRWVNIEAQTGQPNFEYFIDQFQENQNRDYYVLQAHPKNWNKGSDSLREFKKIITFLRDRKHRFMTPYEYYEFVKNNDP